MDDRVERDGPFGGDEPSPAPPWSPGAASSSPPLASALPGLPPPPPTAAHADPWNWAAPPPGGSPRRRRRTLIRVAATGVVVAGVAVGLVVTLGGSDVPGAGVAPARFVSTAAQATLTEHSAHLVVSGTVDADSRTVPVSGTGVVDFSSGQCQLSLSFSVDGVQTAEQEILSGGTLYLSVNADGQGVSSVVPGKDWIAVPLAMSSSSGIPGATDDPVSQLQQLAASGNTVTSLGTSTIDGTTVSGYAVTISAANLRAATDKEAAALGLSPAEQQQVEQGATAVSPPTFDVWIDGNDVVRRVTADVAANTAGQSVAAHLQLDFADFGSAVSVSPPPASQVVSLGDFAAAAGASS